jgi:hypothetical protein
MDIFVGEEIPAGRAFFPLLEIGARVAVLARLQMLEADAAELVW